MKANEMDARLVVFAAAFAVAMLVDAAPMKVRVIQPPYAHDPAKIGESVEWELDALAKCGEDLDVIVLPEASDRQGTVSSRAALSNAVERFNAPHFDQALIDRARAAGLRVNVFWSDDPAEAKRFLDMGVDTILTNDYQPISAATGLR